jgi:uncharacterized Zn finger protein
MKLDFIPRACPLCSGEDAGVLVEATLDEDRLTASAFASRKLPEYMHSRMVECKECGMLYANPVLRPATLMLAMRTDEQLQQISDRSIDAVLDHHYNPRYQLIANC